LRIEPIERTDIATWLAAVQGLQRQIIDQRAYFPDSTADIAADRLRDE
jgi:hypothetical protein